ncbi:hypothetical protein EUGRSUZ_D00832 [Eucalyptus grandis]|uniref:Uncharacterized protein n=2 Tax=Eucalyptus grandis TaxID=71139 RepID=A0ACC3L3Q7_EUCGR|nr:hypothetical protein EUGRSUZ_D00832 [Eucalyptus grandis]
MAVHLRKLAALGGSSSVAHLLPKPKRPAKFNLLAAFAVGSVRGVSTCSADASASRLEGGDGTSYQEFLRCPNGGGTFHESACIDPTALIEVGAVVHPKAVLGAHVHVGSGTVIGPAVTVGPSTKIGYNVSLGNCTVGGSCIIHNGACIGQDGFGFLVDESGNMLKKPQMLNARIGDNVEIGANTCIDRGSWRDTVIGDWSKIDNLVQIGHNAVIGKSCILCGQVGIAGSVTYFRRLCDSRWKGSCSRSRLYYIKGASGCKQLCHQGHKRARGLWWLPGCANRYLEETSCCPW